jgi:hypothetical protein
MKTKLDVTMLENWSAVYLMLAYPKLSTRSSLKVNAISSTAFLLIQKLYDRHDCQGVYNIHCGYKGYIANNASITFSGKHSTVARSGDIVKKMVY